MPAEPRLVDSTAASFDSLPCCGVKSDTHPGRQAKRCWVRDNERFGLRAKTLLAPDGRPCGYIEYLPGEYAWRGVDAAGYLFIHCVWSHQKKYQRQGWAGRMVEAVVAEAQRAGMHGVAAMAREGPWLADRRIYLANRFTIVDTAAPDYELLVRKLDAAAPDPKFLSGFDERAKKYTRGLTLVRAGQCPYAVKFGDEILQAARNEYGLRPKLVELKSCEDARNAPTPYATFALLFEGRVVADHPISRTRFRNIMRKLSS